jgi:RNA polymerase sigma factor (TIGR02999 family)
MSDVTRVLLQIGKGDPTAANQLLPLVYDELRKLAAAKLAQEKPGQTLQATALVHEAYLRLVGGDQDQAWDSRGHFFAAAAEAIRRILIDQARRKQSLKRGGELCQVALVIEPVAAEGEVDVLTLDEALDRLAARDAQAADLVKLRFFAGLTAAQSADALGISERTADRVWAYARSFLLKELEPPPQ